MGVLPILFNMAKLNAYTNKVVTERVSQLPKAFLDFLKSKDAYIFGGFIRDAVANVPFNDIDIITLPRSMMWVKENAEALGIKDLEYQEHVGQHYNEVFKNLYHKIFTLYQGVLKLNAKETIEVDFVNSQISYNEKPKNVIVWAGQQVDIRCCGLLYDAPTDRVVELIPGAYQDATDKIARVITNAGMYSEERTGERMKKLYARGWKSA